SSDLELDRNVALAYVTRLLETGFAMPEEHLFFGDASRAENGELRHLLQRAVRAKEAQAVRIFLGGPVDQWDLDEEAWLLWPDLLRLRGEGRAVEICMSEAALRGLPGAVASKL